MSSRNNVLDRPAAYSKDVTRERTRDLISAGIHRAATIHGDNALAHAANCSVRTIQNAKSGITVPEAHVLGNLLALEPTVLWEWLNELGFKIVPTDYAMSPDMKTAREMSNALTVFIHALEDGIRDHRETLALAPLFRSLIPKMAAIVAEADEHRVGKRS